jgi:hypothetical protein
MAPPFYAEAGACESTRRAVVATVNPLPTITSATATAV